MMKKTVGIMKNSSLMRVNIIDRESEIGSDNHRRRVDITDKDLRELKEFEIICSSGNPKVTTFSAAPIAAIEPSIFLGRVYLWPRFDYLIYTQWDREYIREDDKYLYRIQTSAHYLLIKYRTGSWKNDYERFTGLYDVEKNKFILKIGQTEEIGRELYEALKREMIKEGYAISKKKPVINSISYYLYKKYSGQESTGINNIA